MIVSIIVASNRQSIYKFTICDCYKNITALQNLIYICEILTTIGIIIYSKPRILHIMDEKIIKLCYQLNLLI